MKEITLSVEDKNFQTVMTILENLKTELISNIKTDSQTKYSTQYKPKINKVIREEESGTADKTGKYVNPIAYKQRLKTIQKINSQ